jgi:hypothetical protein
MPRLRAVACLLAAACLALAGCRDERRDAARNYLQAHAPENFEVVAVPEEIPISHAADGDHAAVTVRYRSLQPTVMLRDAFTLPRGRALDERLSAIRGWALATLPAGDSTRDAILAGVVHPPLKVKEIVTPAGTEVPGLAELTLHKQGKVWQVTELTNSAAVPGQTDPGPSIPLADSEAVATQFAALEATAERLEKLRADYLARREQAAARSLAALRSQFRTGRTFSCLSRDGTPWRLVVVRGLDAGEPAVAVLTSEGLEPFTARFTGKLAQEPSGEYRWRAAQAQRLAGVAPDFDLVLTLAPSKNGLEARLGGADAPALPLRPTGQADLIPDPTLPPASR